MATLIAFASASIGGASTFKGTETGASALTMIRANTTTLASNTAISSPSFTATNAKIFDGVLLWLMATATTPAGTLLVEIQKGGVTQTSVTVNCADLPHNSTGSGDVLAVVPCFFKFTGTATGDGGANWTIKLTTSNNASATITYSRNSATAGDFTKAIRTTTSATAQAADDLYITGEFSGAGTHNSFTVTMDGTSAVQYGNGSVNSVSVNGGGIRICPYGTLTFGTTASTNYYLQVKGDIEVFWNGTYNCGVASGSEIPRNSTAITELVMNAAAADFGMLARNGSTVSFAGLSRTSGKNIAWTKSTADVSLTSVLGSISTNNGTNTFSGQISPDGVALYGSKFVDNASAGVGHWNSWPGASVTNVTQVGQVWLAQGAGTHNRFIRLIVGSTNAVAPTNGFFADIDLQAGTIGTCTAIGNGTATSASIVAVGSGFLCTIIGKVSSGAATPNLIIAACSAATTVTYTGDSTDCYHYTNAVLVTASSIGDFTYSVVDDTGWLSGDTFVMAPTQRTISEADSFVMSANAGASSIVTHQNPFGSGGTSANASSTYAGSSSAQGEIGLLTRNVKFRGSASATTGWGYFYAEPLATVTNQWTQFYYLGTNSAPKYGVTFAGTTSGSANAKSVTYCSFETMNIGLIILNNQVGGVGFNTTFDHNVIYSTSNQLMAVCQQVVPPSGALSDITITNNLMIRNGATQGFQTFDPAIAFNHNNVSGCTGFGMILQPQANGVIGNWDNNTGHTNSTDGFRYTGSGTSIQITGTINNPTMWRNGNWGMLMDGAASVGITGDIIVSNPTLFGNASGGALTQGDGFLIQGGGTICGDTSFAQAIGISMATQSDAIMAYNLDNIDMSGTGGIYAANSTTDINIGNNITPQVVARNCKFGAPTLFNTRAWGGFGFIGFQAFNQVAGDHRCELAWGQLRTDPTIYNTASPSQRVTPVSATNKCPSMPRNRGKAARVRSGDTLTVSVAVYKSQASDGIAYNGNQPRLILKANAALGVNSDQVLATYSAGTGSWNTLTGTTPTATDTGEFEFIIDCDGTAGWINIDNPGWTVSGP